MKAVVLVRTPPRVVALVKAEVKNPGSRGGQFRRTKSGKVVYGQTRSGKPIGHPAETVAGARSSFGGTSHVRMHRMFPDWSEQDHRDAAAHHDAQVEAHGVHSELGAHHSNAALAHTIAATNPPPKSSSRLKVSEKPYTLNGIEITSRWYSSRAVAERYHASLPAGEHGPATAKGPDRDEHGRIPRRSPHQAVMPRAQHTHDGRQGAVIDRCRCHGIETFVSADGDGLNMVMVNTADGVRRFPRSVHWCLADTPEPIDGIYRLLQLDDLEPVEIEALGVVRVEVHRHHEPGLPLHVVFPPEMLS